MNLMQFEQQVIGTGRRPSFIRRQQCVDCHSVLALEITEKLGTRASDYYVAKDEIWLAGEPHLVYVKERWFGNWIQCPVCKREGRLPIDKPLSWELIQRPKGEANAVHSN